MKRYGQFCGVAAALDLLGERWTLLIIRDLLTGPKRFNELEESLTGIGPNLLARRLQVLAEYKIVDREAVKGDGRGIQYFLTDSGEDLRPVILGLANWGLTHSAGIIDENSVARPYWGMLAVEALVADSLPPGVVESYEFNIEDVTFHIRCEIDSVSVVRGPAPEPAALVVCADANTFVKVGSGRVSPLEAVVLGKMKIDGDDGALMRSIKLLGLDSHRRVAAVPRS